jgi:hypothetical protein
VALGCIVSRLEAALSDGPLSAACPQGCRDLIFAPGWWCDECGCCCFPDLVRDADDEPDDDFG